MIMNGKKILIMEKSIYLIFILKENIVYGKIHIFEFSFG